MKKINWSNFGLAVGGAFVAGFGSTFGAAVDGMGTLSVPLLKAAVAKSASAGLALAWPVALGFFIPGYKSVSDGYKSAGTSRRKTAEDG